MTVCEKKCVGHYTAPVLSNGQIYRCKGEGCEVVVVGKIDEWCFRETIGDVVTGEEYYTVEVCSSCGGDVGVWDTVTDTDIDCEYEFSET